MPREHQQKVIREMFGIDMEDRIEETEELISHKLERLEEEIELIEHKEAYETALFVMCEYVQSYKFNLAFLRADNFNERSAAKRICAYWDRRVQLFGADKAFKPRISTLDFMEEDLDALMLGGGRFIGVDAGGRGILFNCRKYHDMRLSRVDSMARLYWFILHQAVFESEHSESVQKKGFIQLAVDGRSSGAELPTLATFQRMKILISQFYYDAEYAFPVRFIALHNFVNRWFKMESEHALSFWGRSLRVRLRFYDSTQQESNLHALADCGIGRSMVPTELGGMLAFNYDEWLKNQVFSDMMEGSPPDKNAP